MLGKKSDGMLRGGKNNINFLLTAMFHDLFQVPLIIIIIRKRMKRTTIPGKTYWIRIGCHYVNFYSWNRPQATKDGQGFSIAVVQNKRGERVNEKIP